MGDCDVTETCTSASNSQCATCADGYSANNDGAATVCNRDLLGPIACPTSRATQYHVCEGGTEVHTSTQRSERHRMLSVQHTNWCLQLPRRRFPCFWWN